MFATFIARLLDIPGVYNEFVNRTVDGPDRVKKLVESLKKAIDEGELRRMGISTELPAGQRPRASPASMAKGSSTPTPLVGRVPLSLLSFAAGWSVGASMFAPRWRSWCLWFSRSR